MQIKGILKGMTIISFKKDKKNRFCPTLTGSGSSPRQHTRYPPQPLYWICAANDEYDANEIGDTAGTMKCVKSHFWSLIVN